MGQFRIVINAFGNHGCDRKAVPGERLHSRCRQLDCPDCLAYEFVQTLRQKSIVVGESKVTHYPGTDVEVVDNLITNQREKGRF